MRVKFISQSRRIFDNLTREEQAKVLERLRRVSPPAPRRAGAPPVGATEVLTVLVTGVASVSVRRSARELVVVLIQPLASGEEPAGAQEP
jgi:hypothetical protein